MSADNGVYISKWKKNGAIEYRVAHCLAIDNCDPESNEIADVYQVLYFGNAQRFDNEHLAEAYAKSLADEIEFLEYGICKIDFNVPFPNMFVNEAEKKYKEYWENKISSGSANVFID
jgi:hypothetical protein